MAQNLNPNKHRWPSPILGIQVDGTRLQLRSDGSLFLPEQRLLIISDLHLGKDASFRAAGIPVPTGINARLLIQISEAVEATQCDHLIFLGDLIHNRHSLTDSLMSQFADWRTNHRELKTTLVRGNHDRHVSEFPQSWQLETCRLHTLKGINLVHDPASGASLRNQFFICGHLHPVVTVGSKADRIRLRCFAQYQNHLVMPAFGPFKGGLNLSARNMSACFAISDNQIWCVKN